MKAKVRSWVGAGLLTPGVGVSGAAQAVALVDLGSTVYDPSTGLEWLKDANAAQSLGYDTDGQMGLAAAQAWIAALNTAMYLGHQDWRLPLTAQPDASCGSSDAFGQGYGSSCTGSELGDLFYNKLGGKAGESVSNTAGDTPEQQANLALLTNYSQSVSPLPGGAQPRAVDRSPRHSGLSAASAGPVTRRDVSRCRPPPCPGPGTRPVSGSAAATEAETGEAER